MIRNYIKIAFRNLSRNKIFSGINILGLSIGIATCLIIMLFITNELGYDRYNTKANRIVRVCFEGNIQGEKMKEATVMPPVAQTLKADFPEVEAATRIRNFGTPNLFYGNTTFKQDAFAYVDSNFFQVFTLPFIEGDPKTALLEPNSIVITKAIAYKYFRNEEPIGKVIAFKDGKNTAFKVTGVIDKVPVNSHFHFELFASMTGLPESREPNWMISNFYTYLLLPEGYAYKKLEAKLPQVIEKYLGPQMLQAMGLTLADFRKKGSEISFRLQPLTDIHLHSDFSSDLGQPGDIRYVYIFGAIALFMLMIACINFMNLSTAGASKRSREVGIRKVLGSMKSDLVRQFLLESIILTSIATVVALILVHLALPLFNELANQTLTLSFTEQPLLVPVLILFVLFVGILTGSYPAFYLSSFKPIAVLKGKFTSGKKSIGLRSGLVVFQFIISIILMVSTTVVYNQLSYIRHKKLGYDKEQVLILSDAGILNKQQEVFRHQLLTNPGVLSVSNSGYIPAGSTYNNNFFVSTEEDPGRLIKTLRYDVDENYIPSLGIQLQSGRNFSANQGTDSAAVIVNETAAMAFKWGAKAVDHSISTTDHEGKKITYRVIGVVKDFHFRSLHETISPLVMVLSPDAGTLIVKLKTNDIAGMISRLKKSWAAFTSEEPLSYSFLEDRFNNTYKAEQNTGTIVGIFAGLTIFVACLGLFGLVTFTAEQRRKEIGIRKVLGASVSGIVSLLSKELLKLVFIAFIIAAPVSWFIMNKWLEDFAYRINISWWIFVLAALLAILITIVTVSFQAIKAAIANPVKSLRTE